MTMVEGTEVPDISLLTQAARKIVFDVKKRGGLDSLSVNGIKRQLEREFFLEDKSLNAELYRTAIGDAVKDALLNDTYQPVSKPIINLPISIPVSKPDFILPVSNSPVSNAPILNPSTSNSLASKPAINQSLSKPVAKRTVSKMPNPEDRGRRDFTLTTIPTVKKPRVFKAESQTDVRKKYRSREYIEEDEEDDEDGGDDSAITEGSGNDGKSSSSEKSSSSSRSDSGSEPEKLKRRRKRRIKHHEEKGSHKRVRSIRTTETSDGEEATIDKYKKLVSACGVRKKWSKEFENYPEPKQQIRRLKEILVELGMKGRYSLEKAKQIKKKRALAKELEDVIEYERKAGISRKKRGSKSGRPIGELDTETETSQSDGLNPEEESAPLASVAIKKYLSKHGEDR